MKKTFLGLLIIGIAGIMVFTLFSNKSKADQQAKTANRQSFIPVSTITLQRRTLQSNFSETGTIVANNEVTIVSQTAGKVTAVYVNIGSSVKVGAPLFKVEDTVLSSKLASARTDYEVASREWEREQKLHQEKIISDSELETYKTNLQTAKTSYASAQHDYSNSTITAPVSGIITARPINLGATVSSGTTVATLVDNSTYKIAVNVAEAQAFKLNTGDLVTIETAVYPDTKLSGRIKSVSAKSDAVHTFPVEIIIQNDQTHPLKSGVFGKVTFNLGNTTDVLAIPREALIGSIKTPQVYVVENDHVALRDIVIDTEINSYLVVKDGLRENDRVVVNGQENLSNNTTVKVINQ